MFDEIYDRTLFEKYGSDGEYIAMHQMDADFQRLFMLNIVQECIKVCSMRVGNSDYNTGRMHCASDIREHFGMPE
jgi:hypothetical protein